MGFGRTLAYLRSRSKLTQQELADALGFKSKSTVSMYENGTREPDFETLEVIADYFNVDMNFLIGSSDKEKPVTIQGYELSALNSVDYACTLCYTEYNEGKGELQNEN